MPTPSTSPSTVPPELQIGLPISPEPSPEQIEEQIRYELHLADSSFLAGPRSRLSDLGMLLRITWDFLKTFRVLHFVGPCITIFGSARIKPDSPSYELARKMGARMAEMGFTVMTGGGPGIMEAGNRGAFEAGGKSVGINIRLPFEQHSNPYVDREVTMDFFFTRKTVLIKYSYAFIVLPGGAGTMDELFETMTLIQTGKIRNFPIVLMGREYWQPLIDFIHKMAREGMINPEDPDMILFTDDIDEAAAHVQKFAVAQFNLRKRILPKLSHWLGERELRKKQMNS